MSYLLIDERKSPNYGYDPQGSHGGNHPREIVIHHWGSDGSTFSGTVSWLCNPASCVSAHDVAEAGRVAHILDYADCAFHSGRKYHNQQSIGIECNPRCSGEDKETVAELIADIWRKFGRLPLIGHKDIVPTRCPGRWYDVLDELKEMAEKYYSGEDAPNSAGTIRKGSRVKIRDGARWYGGEEIPGFVMAASHTVDELTGDRAVLDIGTICSPIRVTDLILMDTPAPAEKIEEDGVWGHDTTLALQKRLNVPYRDGILSNQFAGNVGACILAAHIHCGGWDFVDHMASAGSDTARALQRLIGAEADGVIGPDTITCLQRFLDVAADGILGEDTVRALQHWLNG